MRRWRFWNEGKASTKTQRRMDGMTSVYQEGIGSWGYTMWFCPWLSDFNLLTCFFIEEQPMLPQVMGRLIM